MLFLEWNSPHELVFSPFWLLLENSQIPWISKYCQTSNIRCTKSQNLNVPHLILQCLGPVHWCQVLSQEWSYSWSSVDRQCSNYIWVVNNSITYWSVANIRGLTVCPRGRFDAMIVMSFDFDQGNLNIINCHMIWHNGFLIIQSRYARFDCGLYYFNSLTPVRYSCDFICMISGIFQWLIFWAFHLKLSSGECD